MIAINRTILFTLTFCLLALTACQKDLTVTPLADAQNSYLVTALQSPTQNAMVAKTVDGSAMLDDEKTDDLQATIVARRTDANLTTELQQIFGNNPLCQAICYDSQSRYYFGLTYEVRISDRATTITAESCQRCDLNSSIINLDGYLNRCGGLCWWAWATALHITPR